MLECRISLRLDFRKVTIYYSSCSLFSHINRHDMLEHIAQLCFQWLGFNILAIIVRFFKIEVAGIQIVSMISDSVIEVAYFIRSFKYQY